MVRSTLVTAWRLATSPTSTSPPLAKATTEGVVRDPSAFGMTVGSPPSSTATTELVVPRSIPTARAMVSIPPVLSLSLQHSAYKLSALGSTLGGSGLFPILAEDFLRHPLIGLLCPSLTNSDDARVRRP